MIFHKKLLIYWNLLERAYFKKDKEALSFWSYIMEKDINVINNAFEVD